jgi:Yip1-like protein
MASFQDRVIGALKLQASTFEEVENDATATGQAAAIVVAASVASGLGLIFWLGIGMVIRQIIVSLIAWGIGSTVIWAIGTKLMPGKNTQADIPQLLRVLGFAQAPGVFAILTIVPIVRYLVLLVVALWTIAATVVGVKQALDYDDIMKAVIVCLIAFAAYWVAMMLFMAIGFGPRLYYY